MKINSITIDMAQLGICLSASLSVPTRQQYTNETHSFERSYPTKSTLKALWLFRRDAKQYARDLSNAPGVYELTPSSCRRGLFWT